MGGGTVRPACLWFTVLSTLAAAPALATPLPGIHGPGLKEVSQLARSRAPADQERLKQVMLSPEVRESVRVAAIKRLGTTPRPEWVETLVTLAEGEARLEVAQVANQAPHRRGVPRAVAAAAAMKLHRWDHAGYGAERMKKLQTLGVPVREALRTGYVKGQWRYERGASAILRAGLSSEHASVRMDAAAGLVELNTRLNEAKAIFKAVLSDKTEDRWDLRLSALRHLALLPRWSDRDSLLQLALKDSDERVRAQAQRLIDLSAAKGGK